MSMPDFSTVVSVNKGGAQNVSRIYQGDAIVWQQGSAEWFTQIGSLLKIEGAYNSSQNNDELTLS